MANREKSTVLPSESSSSVKLHRTRSNVANHKEPETDESIQYSNDSYQKSFTSDKRHIQEDNSYKLEPDVYFNTSEVEHVVEDVLTERLKLVSYEPVYCKVLSQELAALIMERLKVLEIKRYKLVAVVSIGSLKERPGIQFGSRCLWNKGTDSFASVKYTNGSLFAVAMVYGLYYE